MIFRFHNTFVGRLAPAPRQENGPMNRLAAILPASNVLVDVDASSKKRVFEQAGLLFENQHAIARGTVTDNLFARERLGSTGLGHAVAIPHGRIKGLKNPLAAVLRVQQPIPSTLPTTPRSCCSSSCWCPRPPRSGTWRSFPRSPKCCPTASCATA